MARKEEIEQAAEEYYNKVKYLSDLSASPITTFKAGAEWADKTMLDNVCDFIKINAYKYVKVKFVDDRATFDFRILPFLYDLKQAMEEQVMITENYVSYEVAKLLKEKGFNEPCRFFYEKNNVLYDDMKDYFPKGMTNSNHDEEGNGGVSAPTLQMACKWLREEKHFYIQINLDSWALGRHSGYYIVIQDTNSDFMEISPRVNEEDTVFFSTYEEAVEAAIKYCLENLI